MRAWKSSEISSLGRPCSSSETPFPLKTKFINRVSTSPYNCSSVALSRAALTLFNCGRDKCLNSAAKSKLEHVCNHVLEFARPLGDVRVCPAPAVAVWKVAVLWPCRFSLRRITHERGRRRRFGWHNIDRAATAILETSCACTPVPVSRGV